MSPAASESADMQLFDLRVTVDSIGGRAVCGLAVGDYFDVTESSRLRLVMRISHTGRTTPRSADLT